ncbi:MAG: hypothetical protein WKG07_21000 [Hymenobacter sp.]
MLTDAQKRRSSLEKLAPQLTLEGYPLLTAQDDRSQLRNKEIVLTRFSPIIGAVACAGPSSRRATRPSAGAARKRSDGQRKSKLRKSQPPPPRVSGPAQTPRGPLRTGQNGPRNAREQG